MKTIKSILISLLFVPVLAFILSPVEGFAHESVALPNAGLTPESTFYFVDKIGEALREFFTFNPEARAHLQIDFAAERIAEIKIILETKGVNAKGLEVAQARLQEHLGNAAEIVIKQKSKGKDVSKLAFDIEDDFDGAKSALKEAFKAEKRALEGREKELKAKIREARRAGDTAQVEALVKELGEVKAQKELLELKEEEQEEALEQEEEKIEREMDKKEDAQKAIKEAEEERQEVLDEAAEEGVSVPAGAFEKFDKLLAQAKELFAKENYVGAKQLAKQAEDALEKVDDAIEDLDEAKEDEEELKEERAKEGVKKEEQRQKEAEKQQEEAEEQGNEAVGR
jgi:flagellin-like hook-associated protein FlgL